MKQVFDALKHRFEIPEDKRLGNRINNLLGGGKSLFLDCMLEKSLHLSGYPDEFTEKMRNALPIVIEFKSVMSIDPIADLNSKFATTTRVLFK